MVKNGGAASARRWHLLALFGARGHPALALAEDTGGGALELRRRLHRQAARILLGALHRFSYRVTHRTRGAREQPAEAVSRRGGLIARCGGLVMLARPLALLVRVLLARSAREPTQQPVADLISHAANAVAELAQRPLARLSRCMEHRAQHGALTHPFEGERKGRVGGIH